MKDTIQFFSGLATEETVESAITKLQEQINIQMGEEQENKTIDLAVVFITPHFTYEIRKLVNALKEAFHPGVLLGCTAEGVIGREREVEDGPAISLVAARLPGVRLAPFILQPADWPRLLLNPDDFQRNVEAPDTTKLFVLLCDPFSTPTDDVIQSFNGNYPGIPVVGGMASGALRQFGNALFLNDQIITSGSVGVAFAGSFDVDIIVSPGCRPIWRPFTVTGAQKNVIQSLEGQPPMNWIQELIPELSEEDQALLQNGLFIGRAISSQQDSLGRGDFLIRGVMGIDRESGSITIADSMLEGETVQFHLRDALTAQEDLEMMLVPQIFRSPPSGALLFTCNGRGTRLYDHPDGDVSIIQQNLNGIDLAGFFCAGEIGPVHGQNFLHGHTISLAIFRPQTGEQFEGSETGDL